MRNNAHFIYAHFFGAGELCARATVVFFLMWDFPEIFVIDMPRETPKPYEIYTKRILGWSFRLRILIKTTDRFCEFQTIPADG